VDLGGVRARLIAMGNNHTRGDTAIFIEPDGVLFSGDVTMPGLPAIAADASIRLWLTSQQRLAALRPKRVVPSHGAMGDASMIANYRMFFDTILTRVADLKKQGKTVDEAVSTIQGELKDKFGDAPRIAMAIRTAYVQTQ
jgi:glyoxylase-like metal-dependent hydrolase (beta-lactamase superfamily II)